jgi:predicted Zn finger-like uncharacterized protein
MFTVCPKCTLTLALTTADLRMGQGYVRCGRCANVFNALLSLSEEASDENSAAAAAHEQADPASASQIQAVQFEELGESDAGTAADSADQSAHSADEAVQITEETAVSSQPPASTASEPPGEGAIENESNYAEGTGTLETIVLEGDAITQTEEYVPEASVDSEIAALAERLGRTPDELPGSPQVLAAQFAPPEPEAPAQSQSSWIVLSALMLLLLAAQAVHHWRERLALSALWSAPLTHAYAALGLPLDPQWNLAAYDVRQQGASSDAADRQVIRVRLSLANHAPAAQPVPLVRVTLLDRYGKRLAMRELTPSEYWPAGQPARAFLNRDERIEGEIAVRDPDAASAGFELDVCLRDSKGALRCAADLRPVTARAPMQAR